MNNLNNWRQKHKILWLIVVLIGINVISMVEILQVIPALRILINFVSGAILFVGIPLELYKRGIKNTKSLNSSDTQIFSTSVPANDRSWHERIRKTSAMIYGFGLVPSLMFALLSAFKIMESGPVDIKSGFLWSGILLPVTIIFAMVLSKKSLLWYLLPILPLAGVMLL